MGYPQWDQHSRGAGRVVLDGPVEIDERGGRAPDVRGEAPQGTELIDSRTAP